MSSTAEASPRARSTRRGVLIGFLIGISAGLVLAILALLLLGVLGVPGADDGLDDHMLSIDDEHVSFDLRVPTDVAIYGVAANPDNSYDPECPGIEYSFGSALTIEAFAADCAPDDTEQIINGFHGTYRTIDDVPDPVEVSEVSTDLGTAQVFMQHYEEYTNERNEWDEPVAIVALDAPVDDRFPTMVLRSNKSTLSREEFTAVVESLSPIEPELE